VQVDKSSVEVLSFSRGDGVNVELKLSGSAVRTTKGPINKEAYSKLLCDK